MSLKPPRTPSPLSPFLEVPMEYCVLYLTGVSIASNLLCKSVAGTALTQPLLRVAEDGDLSAVYFLPPTTYLLGTYHHRRQHNTLSTLRHLAPRRQLTSRPFKDLPPLWPMDALLWVSCPSRSPSALVGHSGSSSNIVPLAKKPSMLRLCAYLGLGLGRIRQPAGPICPLFVRVAPSMAPYRDQRAESAPVISNRW